MTKFIAGIAVVGVLGIAAIVILIPGLQKELEAFDRVSHLASSWHFERGDSKSILAALEKHQAAARAFEKLSAKAKDERSSVGAVHLGMIEHLQGLLADARAAEKFRSDAESLAAELGPTDNFQADGDWLDRALAFRSKGKSPQLEEAIEKAFQRRDRHHFASIQPNFEKCIKTKRFREAKELIEAFLKHSQLADERAKAKARCELIIPEAREGLQSVLRECRGLRRLGMSREQALREFDQRTKNNYDVVLPASEIDACIKNLSFE